MGHRCAAGRAAPHGMPPHCGTLPPAAAYLHARVQAAYQHACADITPTPPPTHNSFGRAFRTCLSSSSCRLLRALWCHMLAPLTRAHLFFGHWRTNATNSLRCTYYNTYSCAVCRLQHARSPPQPPHPTPTAPCGLRARTHRTCAWLNILRDLNVTSLPHAFS